MCKQDELLNKNNTIDKMFGRELENHISTGNEKLQHIPKSLLGQSTMQHPPKKKVGAKPQNHCQQSMRENM